MAESDMLAEAVARTQSQKAVYYDQTIRALQELINSKREQLRQSIRALEIISRSDIELHHRAAHSAEQILRDSTALSALEDILRMMQR